MPLDDPEAIDAALSELGPLRLPRPAPRRRPRPADGPVEVVEVAGHAPLLARMATLIDFYGQGRKLTQKAQGTKADARTSSACW